jgi:TM2 domain-containing membrane protein YozV
MTRNDDRSPDPQGSATQGNAPSWVDEVLGSASSPSTPPVGQPFTADLTGPDPVSPPESRPENDLRIPEPPQSQFSPQPSPQAIPQAIPQSSAPAPARPYTDTDADDWIARATGGSARTPSFPAGAQGSQLPLRSPDPWDTRADQRPTLARPPTSGHVPGNIQEKRLIAGLLAIVLGSFGVHKFYLGMNTPGLITLGVNVGVWVLAVLLGLITFGLGLIITLPLAGLVSGALGLLGLVEGILYLTKSDEDFYTQYVLDKKPWL